MKKTSLTISANLWYLSVCTAALLSACGGGTAGSTTAAEAAPLTSGTTTLALEPAVFADAVAGELAQPAFHAAPLLLEPPDDTDAMDPTASSQQPPSVQTVPVEYAGLSSRRLTLQTLDASRRTRALAWAPAASGATMGPLAAGSAVSTYSPAQIRAAYGLPALPASGSLLTATQAAQLGAGQTIYIVDAMHDPNAAVELAAFNQKFGLPACTTKVIPVNTALPLAKPSATACEFSVVYNTASGVLSATAPAYDAGWATEIALDLQWAHATAPLARIVLIEAADASLNSLLGAVKLANAMGPGVVSMSFGANEGSYTASVDAAFSSTGMTYLAATGDSGAAVSWPSVSPNVLAVGGTTLRYGGSGARSEVAWSGTGGGISAYTSTPAYQTPAVPGLGAPARRTVADVSFNADPATGQYTAVMSPGSAVVSWMSVGGTSLSTPQWAGVVAVANALRALASKAALGRPHGTLYGQIGAVPGAYAAAFADITAGSDGSCASCFAKAGYDPLTGLGTPNVGSLLNTLAGAGTATAPVVTPATITGKVGSALTFTASVTAPNALTYALSGAPAGMVVSAAGVVSWPVPAAGTYSVTLNAKDSQTGLSGQGVYTVSIAAALPPVVNGVAVSGKPGTPLSFSVSVTSANAVTCALTGAPAGMTISAAGVVSWASPATGVYKVTVTAKDSKTGLSGQGVYTVTIATAATTASGPVINAAAMTGVAGKALAGTISISDPGATSLSVSISGAPVGMSFTVSGMTLTAQWASAVTGSYSLKVSVLDNAGRTAAATVPVTVR